VRWRVVVALFVLGGCSGSDAADSPDAAPPAPDAHVAPAHLLLSEVYTQVASSEFIEVYNPTGSAVDLSNYYLSDSELYPLLPTAPAAVDPRDFIFRFPAGASLAPGAAAVVAHHEGGFEAAWGGAADFAFMGLEDASAMVPVMTGAGYDLSDVGELVALFYWDGASDLVSDVDLVITGIPQPNNDLPDKSGLTADGPDADDVASAYAADALTMPRFDDVTTNLQSYKRVSASEHGELLSGGNGLGGNDETSEDTARSWGRAATFGSPTPGSVDLAP